MHFDLGARIHGRGQFCFGSCTNSGNRIGPGLACLTRASFRADRVLQAELFTRLPHPLVAAVGASSLNALAHLGQFFGRERGVYLTVMLRPDNKVPMLGHNSVRQDADGLSLVRANHDALERLEIGVFAKHMRRNAAEPQTSRQ